MGEGTSSCAHTLGCLSDQLVKSTLINSVAPMPNKTKLYIFCFPLTDSLKTDFPFLHNLSSLLQFTQFNQHLTEKGSVFTMSKPLLRNKQKQKNPTL